MNLEIGIQKCDSFPDASSMVSIRTTLSTFQRLNGTKSFYLRVSPAFDLLQVCPFGAWIDPDLFFVPNIFESQFYGQVEEKSRSGQFTTYPIANEPIFEILMIIALNGSHDTIYHCC